MTDPTLQLLIHCDCQLVKGRYEARRRLGVGFGGAAFEGFDLETGKPVFMKYLIAPRGTDELARFAMEVDSLRALSLHPVVVVPKYLDDVQLANGEVRVLITEWVDGVPLSAYLERSSHLSIATKLDLLRRVTFSVQLAVAVRRHRDLHPGNILVLADDMVRMGPGVEFIDVEPGVRIVDWGESTPLIFGNYEDEPEHHFTILAREGKRLGGSFASLPPEVFDPPNVMHQISGTYESWALGLIYVSLLLGRQPPVHESIGSYLRARRTLEIESWVLRARYDLKQLGLPGKDLIPALVSKLLERNPEDRFEPWDAKLVLWHVMEEGFALDEYVDNDEFFRYVQDPWAYRPVAGWKYADYDVDG